MSRDIKVDVFVEPDSTAASGYRFWMEQNGGERNTIVFDKNVDQMKKSEHYDVEFKLHNTKNTNLCFSKLKDKVMWAMETDGPTGACPPEGSKFDGFYVDPSTFIDDNSLKVINTDMDRKYFSFCLNFVPKGTVEGPDTVYIPFDPIGQNKNGGTSDALMQSMPSFTFTTVAIAIIAVIGVVAVIWLG